MNIRFEMKFQMCRDARKIEIIDEITTTAWELSSFMFVHVLEHSALVRYLFTDGHQCAHTAVLVCGREVGDPVQLYFLSPSL